MTLGQRFDLSAGARFDHESKDATLETFYEPQIAPPSRVDAEKGFSSVSPQVSAAWRLRPDAHAVRDGRSRLQGGRVQRGVAGRQRSLRRGADLERRGRDQDAVGRRPRHGQRRRLPHRLGRPPVEPAGPGGAGAVLHRQRRRCHQQRRRAGDRGARRSRARPVHRDRLHEGAVRRRQRLRSDRPRGQRGALHARPHHQRRRAGTRASWVRPPSTAASTSRGRARSSTTRPTRSARRPTRWCTCAAATRRGAGSAEFFVRNAFDTAYIPFALPYPNFAPSGFLGEMGAPRTIGASIGVRF